MLNLLLLLESTYAIIFAILYILAILIGITVHEYSHASVAYKLGDQTPVAYGRLTLNPLAHISPLGFLMFMVIGIGYAKPVPINPVKFKHYHLGIFLTSFAGIIANLITAFIALGLSLLFLRLSTISTTIMFITYFLNFVVYLNLSLAVFNLIPIYPLDGYNMFKSIFGINTKITNFIERYSTILVVAVIILCFSTNILSNATESLYSAFFNFWQQIILS